MVVPNCEYGENGNIYFADSGLNENPSADNLSEIAISSSKSFKQLIGKEPRLLCFRIQLMEVLKSELTEKVIEATKLVKEKIVVF